jgi:hypothetical protein
MRRPTCPKHARSVVWLDGTYGRPDRRRQRYKCVPRDGEKAHVFTEPLPRQRTASGHCDECERPWGPDEGAPSARQHSFTASEIAWALTRVGEGWTYRGTTMRVRERAGRVRRVNAVYSYATKDSSTVEDWVEAYAPIIVQPRLSNQAPSILMLDDLPFTIKSQELSAGPFSVAFRVFGALDYRSGKSKLLRLTAYPDARTRRWADFLGQFEGMPDLIVCDAHDGMLNGIRQVWGDRSYHSPVVWLCHWHLREAIYKLVRSAKLQNTNLGRALDLAFIDERRWLRFVRYAKQMSVGVSRWLDQPDPTWWAGNGTRADRVLWQIRNQTYGVPETIQALETKLDWLRGKLNRRKFGFRNRDRTNLLLGLLMHHSNGDDDERAYAREIRLHLEARTGIAPARHQITDPLGRPSLWGY